MSIEQTMLAYARPQIIAARAKRTLDVEQGKGCSPEIAPTPVALEPPFQPIAKVREGSPAGEHSPWVLERPPEEDLVRLGVWVDPGQKCDWNRSERFLKQLCSCRHRAGLEVAGNRKDVRIQLLCHPYDIPIVHTAFLGEFDLCRLRPRSGPASTSARPRADRIAVEDYFPPPPYFHLITQPAELKGSLYAAVATALAFIEPPALGVFQVLFQSVPAGHNWHANVEMLYNLEYSVTLMTGMPAPQRYAQQVPSGELHDMSDALVMKAHNDKPFFFAALRIAVVGLDDPTDHLRALGTFSNLIQSGGRPLCNVGTEDYTRHLSPHQILAMLRNGITYRSGFLVNSSELTTLAHIPAAGIMEREQLPMRALDSLAPPACLGEGTPLGLCDYAGERYPVCIPDDMRPKHAHLIGRTGTGKSSAMSNMILYEIEKGEGVAVLDPHGELVKHLLGLIPERHCDRVVFADPGDPKHVLLWNPLSPPVSGDVPGLDRGRVANDIVKAFKSFVEGWGDRLEHLLQLSLAAVMKLPGGNLRDVADLLRRKSQASERLTSAILQNTDDVFERQFWLEDFARYRQADIQPPQHKLSKLLASAPVRRMLSQPDSAFNFRNAMDSGQILLVDLSTVGSETREVLGCFLLSLLHLAALSRSNTCGPYARFNIYCDEAHRFMTDAMEDLIAETRKFNVSLTLAHQNLGQFVDRKVGALSGVGTTMIFDVDGRDARYLLKDLMGKVEVENLVGQGVGHAVARVGSHVVRVQTRDRPRIPERNASQRIIESSRQRYYCQVEHLPSVSATRAEDRAPRPSEISPTDEDFIYETFD